MKSVILGGTGRNQISKYSQNLRLDFLLAVLGVYKTFHGAPQYRVRNAQLNLHPVWQADATIHLLCRRGEEILILTAQGLENIQ